MLHFGYRVLHFAVRGLHFSVTMQPSKMVARIDKPSPLIKHISGDEDRISM